MVVPVDSFWRCTRVRTPGFRDTLPLDCAGLSELREEGEASFPILVRVADSYTFLDKDDVLQHENTLNRT